MAIRANQINVGTSATELFDGLVGTVTIIGAAAFSLGAAGVTTGDGLPCPANVPVYVNVNGERVYAVGAASTQVGYFVGGN